MSDNVTTGAGGRAISAAQIDVLADGEVFVFGSNPAGHHAAGAARFAVERFGAVVGEGHGMHGRSYAIDTMSGLPVLRAEAATFLAVAAAHPELTFLVTEVGCGIAGYVPEEVASAFAGAGANVALPASFAALLDEGAPGE